MTFSLLGTARCGGQANGTAYSADVVGTKDTTGSKLFVFAVAHHKDSTVTVADSHGNSYTSATVITGSEQRVSVFYCINPTTGAATNWSNTGTVKYSCAHIGYFANDATVTGIDVQNGSSTTGATVSPGSITPSYTNSLVIAAAAAGGTSGTFSIDGGFTIPTDGQSAGVSATSYAGMLAYLIQTSAASANPSITLPVSGTGAAKILSFYASDGSGGGSSAPKRSLLLGVG